MTLRQRPCFVHYIWAFASSADGTLFGDGHKGRDFQMIAPTPLSCGELMLSTCSHKSDFSVFDSYLSTCVYLLAVCLHALYSLHSTSFRNLGRGVFKGGSSNYVKVGSLTHLNLPTALLPPHMSCIFTRQCGLVVLSKTDLRSRPKPPKT